MKIRTCAALLLAVGLPTAVFAVNFPEIEPNDSKAQATANGTFVLSSGDTITGNSTGTSTTVAGATSADYHRVRSVHASSGVYRHRMTITTAGAAGHVGTLRGASQTGGVINATSDITLQTSSSSTTPARFNQWYGMGAESEIYYRVTGTGTTTGDYVATFDSVPVTVTPFAVSPESGTMRIFPDAATDTAYDTLTYLYDSNFNPIAGWDDADSTGITANLAPGTYYYSISRFTGYAGQFPRLATSSVIDFANSALATSTTSTGTQPATIIIDDVTANVISASGDIIANAYDMAWFSFTVVPPTTPTNPTGTGSATPASVLNDGIATTTLRVTVTPGQTPISTFLTTGTVTVDGSSIGGGTITLLDDGVAPDLVAGDLIFSADTVVAPGTPAGAATLPFLITDDQARNGSGNIALTVTTPPPGCASGLATLSFSGVSSNGAIADAGNSIVTGDFGIAGSINTLTITGRYTSFPASYRSEARIRMTAPDGSFYDTAAFAGAPATSGEWDVLGTVVTLPTVEDGTGTWSFEFWESFADTVNPDATWVGVCFAANLTATNPTATGVATPNNAVNDGSGVTTLSVTVVPGAEPTSTFLTTGSVTVDGSLIGAGTVTLLDNGVAPDAVAGDLIFTANAAVSNGTPAGSTPLPFFVTDDQGRSAAGGNIAFTVTTPPPGCPSGLATLSFTNVQGDGAVGDVDNSIVTGDFGFAGNGNVLRMSGRMVSNALFNLEARVRATAPDGSFYDLQPFTTTPSTSPRDLTSIDFVLPSIENGTGTWTFEFFESFNDAATPDVTWPNVCFSIDQASTPLAATDVASGPVVRDGVATSTLTVTVVPAAFPASTGIAVVVDDSSVGGSGSLSLLDDGNAPDVTAGDNIFSGTTTVAYTTALGTATLPYTVTDVEGGNFAGSLNFTVSEASGACCVSGGCVVTTIGDCLDVQGGTFAGTGTACTAPTALTTDGAGAFEDISGTGTLIADLEGDDDANAVVTLPFTFNYFGNDYTSIGVCTNGFAQFTGTSTTFTNTNIPAAGVPNDSLYVLWDDHDFDVTGHAYTQLLGTIGVDARFIIQWNTVGQYNVGLTPLDSNTYQIALFEDGSFEYRYLAVAAETTADFTTIGFENLGGTIAHQSAETRDTLAAAAPVSFRANSTLNDTGICGNGCPPCAADYDGNGGVDGGDLGAFFADFEAGETCADVDGNGGVDGGDLGFFFFVFEAGGCE